MKGYFMMVVARLAVQFDDKGRRRDANKVILTEILKLWLFMAMCCTAMTGKGIAAESWGAALFRTTQHDFGQVVLGADAEYRFELANPYTNDLKLLKVSASCTCASARFSAPLLKPGEKGAVIVRLNTSGQHLRDKSAVLTVRMETVIRGSRQVDTVQLFVSGYIRSDVVLTPGSLEFGSVPEGTTANRVLQLEYTGRSSSWGLTRAERSLPFVSAQAEEVRRERGNVVYKITATLRENAPAGYFKDVIRFTTNEKQAGKSEPVAIILPVQGVVAAPIRAKPSPMLVGILSPQETATKSIVIRNEIPFRITDVSASDNQFRFAFSDKEGLVQLLSISYTATQTALEQPQDIVDVLHISTDDPQQVITVNVFVRLIP
ncbi:MAG: DUF1573 domain-containing protein [Planctomycetaceae bacterium]|jgi:hypothetical protein|nr:DUF1573 domain-containing protein [Planctomycetaceae bacterium]